MGISLTRTTSTPMEVIDDVLNAIDSVVKQKKETEGRGDDNSFNTMNIEPTYMQTYSPVSSSSPQHTGRVGSRLDFVGQIIPPLLQTGVLGNIPPETLCENLGPIVRALKRLDAERLLGLQRSSRGPQVREGQYVRPIYDEVTPAVARSDPKDGKSCVRYLHVSEVPDQYSIGIFVFAPFSRIPLHDHPDMCVLSRVLYGDLQRVSLDLAREHESDLLMDDKNKGSGWLGEWRDKLGSSRRKLPKGSKQAFKNHIDYLQAPDVTILYPYEGNLHEFVAGPDGAAVLDVLLPPYDNAQNRDCTFYEIRELSPLWSKPSGKEPCFIIPTGQPEDFHCISGKYRDLGDTGDTD